MGAISAKDLIYFGCAIATFTSGIGALTLYVAPTNPYLSIALAGLVGVGTSVCIGRMRSFRKGAF